MDSWTRERQALTLVLSRCPDGVHIGEVGRLVSGSKLAAMGGLVGSVGEPESETPSEFPIRVSSG